MVSLKLLHKQSLNIKVIIIFPTLHIFIFQDITVFSNFYIIKEENLSLDNKLIKIFIYAGERTTSDTESSDSGVEGSEVNTITEAGLEAIVDLRKAAVFNEPFYIVVLERTDGGSTVHMWRLTVSSQADPSGKPTFLFNFLM